MDIYLDIETIPGQSPAVLDAIKADAEAEKSTVRAPSNYKDQAKIEEFVAAKHAEIDAAVDEKWRKTSFDGAFGQIVVASIAIDDAEPIAFYRDDWKTSERHIISDLFAALRDSYRASSMTRPVFIGHNVVAFDLRFIFHRAALLGIVPPAFFPINPRPWDSTVFDTMVAWAGVGNRVSLDKLCRAFGIQTKGSELGGEEIDGSKVWDFVQAGRITDVATYCKADVRRVRALHRFMTFSSPARTSAQIQSGMSMAATNQPIGA